MAIVPAHQPFAAARCAHHIPESRHRGPERYFKSLLKLMRPLRFKSPGQVESVRLPQWDVWNAE